MTQQVHTFVLLAVPVVLLAALSGCSTTPQAPPEEAVLEGTWAVTADAVPDLTSLALTFNGSGKVTQVQYRVGDNAVITDRDPRGTAKVHGTNVTLTSVTFIGGAFGYTGTLNADNTVITGTPTLHIAVGSLTVALDGEPATLTRQ